MVMNLTGFDDGSTGDDITAVVVKGNNCGGYDDNGTSIAVV